jgi:hypothetical protein
MESDRGFVAWYDALKGKDQQASLDQLQTAAADILGRPVTLAEITGQRVERRLEEDINLAIDYGVQQLPTLIVAGRKYEGCPERRETVVNMLAPLLVDQP